MVPSWLLVSSWLKLATALDPRFKDLNTLPKSEREEVFTLGGMLPEQLPRRSPQTSEDGPPKKKMSLLLEMCSDPDSAEEVQPGRDVHRYRAEPSLSMEDSPFSGGLLIQEPMTSWPCLLTNI